MNPFVFLLLYLVFLALMATVVKNYCSEKTKTWYAFFAGIFFALLFGLSVYLVPSFGQWLLQNGTTRGPCGNATLGSMMLHFFVLTPLVLLGQMIINRAILKINIFKPL